MHCMISATECKCFFRFPVLVSHGAGESNKSIGQHTSLLFCANFVVKAFDAELSLNEDTQLA